MIDGQTLLYGIIGNPVHHSLSPVMHNRAFAALDMNGVYVPMPVTDLAVAVQGLRALGFRGVSVTVPHKEAIISLLDEVDPVAQRIGAVNTLLIRERPSDGKRVIRGFNTDWLGANLALADKVRLEESRVLILGAGGAAKAIAFGLVEAGATVILSNRTVSRGMELADWLGCTFVPLTGLASVEAEVLVNTTTVGMEPHSEDIPLDPGLLHRFTTVMDIVYAPLQTRLLREAAACGCTVIDGLAMLVYQGAAQFRIWTGIRPDIQLMRRALEERLASG